MQQEYLIREAIVCLSLHERYVACERGFSHPHIIKPWGFLECSLDMKVPHAPSSTLITTPVGTATNHVGPTSSVSEASGPMGPTMPGQRPGQRPAIIGHTELSGKSVQSGELPPRCDNTLTLSHQLQNRGVGMSATDQTWTIVWPPCDTIISNKPTHCHMGSTTIMSLTEQTTETVCDSTKSSSVIPSVADTKMSSVTTHTVSSISCPVVSFDVTTTEKLPDNKRVFSDGTHVEPLVRSTTTPTQCLVMPRYACNVQELLFAIRRSKKRAKIDARAAESAVRISDFQTEMC